MRPISEENKLYLLTFIFFTLAVRPARWYLMNELNCGFHVALNEFLFQLKFTHQFQIFFLKFAPEQPSPHDHPPRAPEPSRRDENACRPFAIRARLRPLKEVSKTSSPPPCPSNCALNHQIALFPPEPP